MSRSRTLPGLLLMRQQQPTAAYLSVRVPRRLEAIGGIRNTYRVNVLPKGGDARQDVHYPADAYVRTSYLSDHVPCLLAQSPLACEHVERKPL